MKHAEMQDLPLWMRGSKSSMNLTSSIPSVSSASSKKGKVPSYLNNADSESDEEDEEYFAQKKVMEKNKRNTHIYIHTHIENLLSLSYFLFWF